MTYKEAKKHIDDNWDKANPYTSNPNAPTPHQVVALIVAPTERDSGVEQDIFTEVHENKKDNADVLLDMNLFGKELSPYVVVLMRGSNICLPLYSYISSPTFEDKKD
ncbi:MAG: hypothetical protein CUR34_09460 [Sediminibacterium sp.]|nr:MAG: hypothetical protein CUR34_09460 [Sediminibacterium sp.] [Sediminibacterium sp. FEMGT703S]